MTEVTSAARADLAPTGKLCARINYGDFHPRHQGPTTGESSGVAVDLLRDVDLASGGDATASNGRIVSRPR